MTHVYGHFYELIRKFIDSLVWNTVKQEQTFYATCLGIIVKNTKIKERYISIRLFLSSKNLPLFSMSALTTVAFFRKRYPKFPVARKPTPLSASPISLQRMLDKMFLFFDLDLPTEVISGWGYLKLHEKASSYVIKSNKFFFFRGKPPGKIHIFKSERNVSQILASYVYFRIFFVVQVLIFHTGDTLWWYQRSIENRRNAICPKYALTFMLQENKNILQNNSQV